MRSTQLQQAYKVTVSLRSKCALWDYVLVIVCDIQSVKGALICIEACSSVIQQQLLYL